MSWLQSTKAWVIAHSGLAKDALHIHVALLLFFGSAIVFRWKLTSWKPWLVVVAAALIGEMWDLRDSLVYDSPVRLGANLHDVWNTLLWPSAILLMARWSGAHTILHLPGGGSRLAALHVQLLIERVGRYPRDE